MRIRIVSLSLLIILVFTACNFKNESKTELEKDARLIGYKTEVLAELGEVEFEELLNKYKTDIRYINDIIYVSYVEEHNACGSYQGEIKFSNDTIFLSEVLLSDEVCNSLRLDRVTFIINNPDETKKNIQIKK
jgi:hypothetical protein